MKSKKAVGTILTAVVVFGILWIGDLFLGNPISYGIVKYHSQKYLQEQYPELSLQVEKIYHDWYSGGGYEVTVTSPVSQDTAFKLHYDRLGILRQDCYEMTVASGNSTMSRLLEEYDAVVASALSGFLEHYEYKAGLSCIDGYTGQPVPLRVGIDPAELQLDKEYNVAQLGWEYGYINLTIQESRENVTVEKAAQYLLHIQDALDAAGIGWCQFDLYMSEEDGKDPNVFVGINGITAADLGSEDLIQHLTGLRDSQLEYWLGPKEE